MSTEYTQCTANAMMELTYGATRTLRLCAAHAQRHMAKRISALPSPSRNRLGQCQASADLTEKESELNTSGPARTEAQG